MKTAVKAEQQATAPTSVEIFQIENVSDHIRAISESIERRAYEIFEARGRQPGQDVDDWCCAESELAPPFPVQLTELDDRLTVRAELPEISAQQIKIGLGPQQLVIVSTAEQTAERERGEIIAGASKQICRVLDLPVEVDRARAKATMQNGVLDLTLPKLTRADSSRAPAG